MILLNKYKKFLDNVDRISGLDCNLIFHKSGIVADFRLQDYSKITYRITDNINIESSKQILFINLVKYLLVIENNPDTNLFITPSDNRVKLIRDNQIILDEELIFNDSDAKIYSVFTDDLNTINYSKLSKPLFSLLNIVKDLEKYKYSNFTFINRNNACKIKIGDINIVFNSAIPDLLFGNQYTLLFCNIMNTNLLKFKANYIYIKNENYELIYQYKYDFKAEIEKKLPDYSEFKVREYTIKEDYFVRIDKIELEKALLSMLNKIRMRDAKIGDDFYFVPSKNKYGQESNFSLKVKNEKRYEFYFPLTISDIHLILAFLQNENLKNLPIVNSRDNLINLQYYKKENMLKLNNLYIQK